MSTTAALENLLTSGNWDAVKEAQRLGPQALPVVQTFSHSQNSVSRQIAMSCASRIAAPESAAILSAGLTDKDINVQLTAAKELDNGKFPGAFPAILDQLANGKDDLVREFLALDAGFISGDKTIAILWPLVQKQNGLATNAKMALARLRDSRAHAMLLQDLSSPTPRVRYDALDQLRYVDDQSFVPRAKELLSDQTPARRIGTARNPRFRRISDQAMDTLASLLKLKTAFEMNPGRIYTAAELSQFRQLVP